MPKVSFSANMRASSLMRVMTKHSGDLSEGDKANPIATRMILGRKVAFYTTGEHIVEGDLTEEEQYNSELLRFAHASLIAGEPVGDKRYLYVDASCDPCIVWMDGKPAAEFVADAVQAIRSKSLSTEIIVDGNPLPYIRTTNDV